MPRGPARTREGRSRGFTSRETALLGLMAALWGATEIVAGGIIKGSGVPFGTSLLAAFGVVVLLAARRSVPRRWSTLLVGAVAAEIRFISGVGGAVFAAAAILIEAAIVEACLSIPRRPGRSWRLAAGMLAVSWSLAHPFVIQGYVAGLGPARVYALTVGLLVGGRPPGTVLAFVAIGALAIGHVALGAAGVAAFDRLVRSRVLEPRGGAAPAPAPARAGAGAVLSITVTAVVILTLLCGKALAATGGSLDSDLPVYLLPEVTVVATRLTGPYAVEEVDAEEIETSGATDLADVLEAVPGIVLTMGSRGEPEIGSRGLTEREIVVLVDGVPLADPYGASVSLATIPAAALEGVRVTKGPAASVYGANALGGVVEVTTGLRGREGFSYSVSAGSDGAYTGTVAAGGPLARGHVSAGLSTHGESGFTLPSSYEAETWENGGRRDFSSNGHVFTWLLGEAPLAPNARAALTLQLSEGAWEAPASTTSERPRFWEFPFWRETRAIGALEWHPQDDVLVEVRAFAQTNDNTLVSYADADRTDRQWKSSVSNFTGGGYVFVGIESFERHGVSLGMNARTETSRRQSDVGEEWKEYEAVTMSVFGQDSYSLTPDDLLCAAANLDMVDAEGRFLWSVNPQVAWRHRFGGGLSVRALAGIKTRFPTLKEWFSAEIGNADLEEERGVSAEFEVSKVFSGDTDVRVLAFEQRVSDMIVSAGWGEPAENIGRVEARGVEMTARHRPTPMLELAFTLAFTYAEDVEEDEEVPYVPGSEADLRAVYRVGPGTYRLAARRVGNRRSGYGDELPSYLVVDARAVFETRWGEIFAGVDNVFDELYEDDEGYPQAGRRFEVGVSRDLFR